jgi:hypothetical protein
LEARGARLGSTSWNDAKARVEHGGLWFEHKNRGLDYRMSRYRRAPRFVQPPLKKWIFLLLAISILYPMCREATRSGWLPDTGPTMAFPATGSVTVNRTVDPRTAISRMRVTTARANAVVQLYDPASDAHIISVYVRRDDDVTVPVPPGTYRVRVIEGNQWHGPVRFFGPSTSYETVARLMTFTDRQFSGVDLHRRIDGTLKTRANFGNPPPL